MAKWWVCGVAVAVVVVSVSVIWGITQPAPIPETDLSAAPADAAVTEAALYGVLGVWDGKLALFCGSNSPTTVYDVWVETLPVEEQQKLEHGIEAPSRAAFLRLLQEYTG